MFFFFFFPLFQQKYLARYNPSAVHSCHKYSVHISEPLAPHLMSQRVPAVPCESQILSCSSIFGTQSIDKVLQQPQSQAIKPACEYTNHSQKCTAMGYTCTSPTGGDYTLAPDKPVGFLCGFSFKAH